ncbi:MAG: protein phosphatase 2C domain-containing protein [Chloroflexota bacterium]
MLPENQPYEIGSASHTGRKRRGSPNQDYVKVVMEPARLPLLIVADGMGGHRGGAVASQVAAEAMMDLYRKSAPGMGLEATLKALVTAGHRALLERAAQEAELKDMGTTIVAGILEPNRITYINVGDSRLYLFRGRQVIQLSLDQSWVAEQIRAGLITPEQARNHPKRSHLMMSLSAKRANVTPHTGETALLPDDIVLLCSDGLWGAVPESLILAAASELPPQKAAEQLIDLANTSTGPDNISVIVARRKGYRLPTLGETELLPRD